MTLHAKIVKPDLQRNPGNLNLIKNMKKPVVFLTQHVFISVNFSIAVSKKCASHVSKETTNENSYSLNEQKHGYFIHTWSDESDKAIQGIIVTVWLPFLHRESL